MSVTVTPSASYTVAAESVGSQAYQMVKLVGGQSGSTQPIPGDSSLGLGVQVLNTPNVAVSTMPAISGAVQISNVAPVTTQASVSVTGIPVWWNPTAAVVVNTAPTVAGASVTVQQGASVSLPAVSGVTATSGVVASSQFGIPVYIAGGQSIASDKPVWITGTVAAGAGTTVISGTVAISIPVSQALGTVITILGTQVVTLATGGVVTMVGAVSITGVSVGVVVSGPVSISAMPAVSISVSAALGTVITVLGTQIVTLATGGSVTLVGTVGASIIAPVSVSSIVPVTTAASVSVTGWPVWMNPTQGVQVSGLVGHSITGSVNIVSTVVVSGLAGVSVSFPAVSGVTATSGPVATSQFGIPVWIAGGQSLASTNPIWITGTVAAGAGTTVVSQKDIVPVTTAASVSVSGWPVWMNPTQTIAVSGAVAAVTSQLNTTGAPVWLAPTQTITVTVANALYTSTAVTTGTAQAVWIMNPTTVTVTIAGTTTGTVSLLSIVPVTTAASVSISGIPVWMNPTQGVQVSGLVGHSITGSVNIVSTAVVTLATGGTLATLLGTVLVDIANISISTTTGTPALASTGLIVVCKDNVYQPVMIMVTSTAIAQSAAMYLMTIWTGGTVAAAATTAWPVPAGKNFRAYVLQAVMTTSAVVGGTVQFVLLAATATASMVSGSLRTQGFQLLGQGVVTALPVQVGPMFAQADTPAATTIGVAIIASTAAVLNNVIVQGYLF